LLVYITQTQSNKKSQPTFFLIFFLPIVQIFFFWVRLLLAPHFVLKTFKPSSTKKKKMDTSEIEPTITIERELASSPLPIEDDIDFNFPPSPASPPTPITTFEILLTPPAPRQMQTTESHQRPVQVTRAQDIILRSQIRRGMPPGRRTIERPKIVKPVVTNLTRFAPSQQQPKPVETLPPPPTNTIQGYSLDMVKAAIFRRLAGGKCAFTSASRTDGVGAQALGKISTMVMCKALGFDYAHHPFQLLEHVDNSMKPGVYVKMWEQLLSIGGNSRVTFDRYPHSKHLDANDLGRSLAVAQLTDGWAYVVRDAHSFTNRFRSNLEKEWCEVIRDVRVRYSGPRVGLFNRVGDEPRQVHVAVHIRRGDATTRGPVISAQRVLSNDYFASVMAQVNTVCANLGRKCSFHVISEGRPSDFTDLTTVFPDLQLHLSEPSVNINHQQLPRVEDKRFQPRNQHLMQRRGAAPPASPPIVKQPQITSNSSSSTEANLPTEGAFKLLVGADVLIMSKSAFSFLAALYSTGVKIFPPEMVNGWDIPIWCEKEDKWFYSSKLTPAFDECITNLL
jgi:hypothetical protein